MTFDYIFNNEMVITCSDFLLFSMLVNLELLVTYYFYCWYQVRKIRKALYIKAISTA